MSEHSLHQVWEKFLIAIKKHNLSLAAILQSGQVMPGSNGVVKVGVFYKFHKEQLEKPKFFQILNSCARELNCRAEFEFLLIDKQELVGTGQRPVREKQAAADIDDLAEALM